MKTLAFQQKTNKQPKSNAVNSSASKASYAGFAISFLLHFALFATLYDFFQEMDLQQNGDNVTTISLATFTHSSNENTIDTPKPIIHKKKHHHKEIIKEEGKIAKETGEITPQSKAPKTEQSEKLEEGDVIQTLAFNEGSKDELFSKIQSAIDRRNKYPPMARKQGLEDKVVVEFIIHKNGDVSHIHLIEPCPHHSLNFAALNAVKRAQKAFPRLEHTTRIRLPIIYKLDRV